MNTQRFAKERRRARTRYVRGRIYVVGKSVSADLRQRRAASQATRGHLADALVESHSG